MTHAANIGSMGASLPRICIMDAAFLSGLAMAPNENDQGAAGLIREAMPQIAAATCLVMIGTCLNMWSTQQVIQQNIQTIGRSDNEQTRKIEKLEDRVNTLAIQQEAHKSRMIDLSRRIGQ